MAQLTLPSAQSQIKNDPTELIVRHVYHDDEALQGAPFIAKFADASIRKGVTDADGNVRLTGVPPGTAQIQFKPDARQFDLKMKEMNPNFKTTLPTSDIDSLINKYRGKP